MSKFEIFLLTLALIIVILLVFSIYSANFNFTVITVMCLLTVEAILHFFDYIKNKKKILNNNGQN